MIIYKGFLQASTTASVRQAAELQFNGIDDRATVPFITETSYFFYYAQQVPMSRIQAAAEANTAVANYS